MESIQQLLATGDMPMREDGTIDLTELARMSLEDMVNQIMDIQADELVGEVCLVKPQFRECARISFGSVHETFAGLRTDPPTLATS